MYFLNLIRSDSENKITLRSAGFTLQNHITKGSFFKPSVARDNNLLVWLYLKNMEKENTVRGRRWRPILDQQCFSRHTFVSKQRDVSAKDYANFFFYLWRISVEQPTFIKWPLADTPRVQWQLDHLNGGSITQFFFFSVGRSACLKPGKNMFEV